MSNFQIPSDPMAEIQEDLYERKAFTTYFTQKKAQQIWK